MEILKLTSEDIAKLKTMVGRESEPYKVEADKSMFWQLAEAIGDTNPLWQDEITAKKTQYKGIIAPPAFYISFWMNPLANGKIILPITGRRGFDAEHEWKFNAPIHPGDVITVKSKIINVLEKQGKKSGLMAFCTYETTLTNQYGVKVAVELGIQVML